MRSTITRILAIVGGFVAVLVLLALGYGFSRLLTEYEWYRSLGQANVFSVRITSKLVLWAAASLFAFAVLYINARIAERLVELSKVASRVVLGATALLAAFAGLSLAGNWMTFRLAVAQAPFGLNDPYFGKDVGFFVFTLPALEKLGTWANGLVVLSIIIVLSIVLLPSKPGVTRGMGGQWWRLKTVLSVLMGFLMLWAAFTYWISIWQLMISPSGQFDGASYTDIHAKIPAYWILAAASAIVAVVLFATARSKRWGVLIGSFALWGVLVFSLGTVWPYLMQTYGVAPNEATRELPYIANNIKMTREAFELTKIENKQYSAVPTLTADAAAKAVLDLADARLWSAESVKQAYGQLQTIRPYYSLSPIDTDRYDVNGRPEETLVSARQMNASLLPKKAQTWVNLHLVYTHGYGMIVSSATGATSGGFPQFLVGDVPPKVANEVEAGSPDLKTTQPRVYFGPDTTDYVIVNADIDEFDYAAGDKNVMCRYEGGSAGPKLGSFANRLAWAVRLGSNELIFSDYIKPDSQVLINRDIPTRVRKLAPWLSFDKQAYPALVDGRITWILDAYTMSDHFPYAQPLDDGTNYMRNSVKVTVDALTGETKFYAFGEDPIRDAWAKIFPGLITPESDITPSLAKHLRYPKKFFTAQAKVYRTYHITDPQTFYNKEDLWQVPGEQGDNSVKASYLMLDPDASGRQLHLLQPYAPVNRNNMIGLFAASCGPEKYGQQTVYQLPKERVVLGAQQIVARIEQDPTISPQLSLWDQRGSKVLFGEMLILPVEGTITYIQPLFLQAQNNAITELVGVVAANGDKVAMGSTLADALDKLYGANTPSGMTVPAGTDGASGSATETVTPAQ